MSGGAPTAADRNVRFFIAFRVLFNSRFYYPIFTILFLDFGLTLEQFALLNSLWAATIVLCEVPSGALADKLGRPLLMRVAGLAMVAEIALLCLVPAGAGPLLFAAFAANRILSGLAEAAASGADESIAYDALKSEGREGEWPRVLERVMRWQSAGFVVAMALGAAVYDPALVSAVLGAFGLDPVGQAQTLKLPLLLNLATALAVAGICFRFRESRRAEDVQGASTASAWRETFRAGLWIVRTPLAFTLILGGLFFDSIVRLFATIQSEYFRAIDLPEASYGVIGAGTAALGIFLPRVARWMVENLSLARGTLVLAGWVTFALVGLAWFIPYAGLLFAAMAMVSMTFVGYFLSHHLNRIAEPRRRATILSFRGLAFNLGYGILTLAYSALVAALREGDEGGDAVFRESLHWFAPWFVLTFAVLAVVYRIRCVPGPKDR